MRASETHALKAGDIIKVWTAPTGDGDRANIQLSRPYVVPVTGQYLVETDTVMCSVTFRHIPGQSASEEHVDVAAELDRRARRRHVDRARASAREVFRRPAGSSS